MLVMSQFRRHWNIIPEAVELPYNYVTTNNWVHVIIGKTILQGFILDKDFCLGGNYVRSRKTE